MLKTSAKNSKLKDVFQDKEVKHAFHQKSGFFFLTLGKSQISKMKGYFAILKDFSPKLKFSEILFLKPQNR